MKCHPLRRSPAVAVDFAGPLYLVTDHDPEEAAIVDAVDGGNREVDEAGDMGAEGACELVTVPAREGLEAADILRLRRRVGPVFHDREGDTLGFVVPPGTAKRWDLPGSDCRPARGPLSAGLPPVGGGSGWVVAPDGAIVPQTEPELLRGALCEASRLLALVDRCGAAKGGAPKAAERRRRAAPAGPPVAARPAASDWSA